MAGSRKHINKAGIEYADIRSENRHGEERVWPDLEEIVICRVSSIAEMGVYVELLEYNKLAMILLPEISKGKFKNIRNIVYPGDVCACTVIRVDPLNSYIDLSLSRVTKTQSVAAFERFHRAVRGPWADREAAIAAAAVTFPEIAEEI